MAATVCRTAASADEASETLGVEWIVGEPVQALGFHASALPTLDPAQEVLEIDTLVATGEIAGAPQSLVVACPGNLAADVAHRFFRRRRKVITTACGSPKTPQIVRCGTKPGNR